MTRALGVLTACALLTLGCGSRDVVNLDGPGDRDFGTSDFFYPRPDGAPIHDGPTPDRNWPFPDFHQAPDIFIPDGYVPPDFPKYPDFGVPDMPVTPDGPPPSNDTCAKAKALTLVGGKVTESDSTVGAKNQYGTAINCSINYYTMVSGQKYYKVTLKAGQAYKFDLTSQYYSARMYIFSSCGISAINKDCASGGATGDVSGSISKGYTGSIIFKPTIGGTYLVAVDGTSANYSGDFKLSIAEYTKPTNTSCKGAKILTVPAGGSVKETGSTIGAPNEFGTGINCGSTYYTHPGSQVYYKVYMTAGKTYRVSVKAGFSTGAFYIFGNTCTMSAINAACGSNGAAGAHTTTLTNQPKSIQFKPPSTGYYTVAIDSRYAQYSGNYELVVEDWTAPTNDKCAKPTPLTLVGGKVTTKGSTFGAAPEFGNTIKCNTSYSRTGAQVYYSVYLTAGKSYSMTLKPSFTAFLYVFNSACNAPAINASCGSNGLTGATSGYIMSGNTGVLTFKPSASGTYKIAVDSYSTYYSGSFDLTVEEKAPPSNQQCSNAQLLTLVGGKASVAGDTTGATNDFGTSLTCGYAQSSFDGPNLYYYVSLAAGKTYIVRLKPSYTARFYVFGNSCQFANIEKDCSSNGATGAWASVYSGATGEIFFKVTTGGIYRIGVDSYYPSYFGKFQLEVEETKPVTNTTCASAQNVTLAAGMTIINGNTKQSSNEFGTAINCTSMTTILRGNQLYYRVALTAGKTYSFTLTPGYYSARLYIFGKTCTYTAINSDCGSKGVNGDISGYINNGSAGTVKFTPTTSGSYTIAVDSTSYLTSGSGPFTLQIQQ